MTVYTATMYITTMYTVQVACGWKHILAKTCHGRIYACGWGGSMGDAYSFDDDKGSGGQLGVGDDFDRGVFTPVAHVQVGAVCLDGMG